MRQLIIMRGVPGSGKSTLAHHLVKNAASGTVCSADDHFTFTDGSYFWDPALLGAAHGYCKQFAADAMAKGASPVVIDNTNIQERDYALYVELARNYGYDVVFVTMAPPPAGPQLEAYVDACVARGTHAVPRATVMRMAERLRK